jgi:hypothetical protein
MVSFLFFYFKLYKRTLKGRFMNVVVGSEEKGGEVVHQ